MTLVIPGIAPDRKLHSRIITAPLVVPRRGVMIHYDDSASDEASLRWFQDPACRNGYTWLVLDDGELIELADPALRTPHAGPCLTPQANSVFYGIAAATDGQTVATAAQVERIRSVARAVLAYHGWPWAHAGWRVQGHNEQAIWTPATTRAAGLADAEGERLWSIVGRKADPIGERTDRVMVVDLAALRELAR